MRTIKGASGHFTCMTTIGDAVAAACDNNTMDIYDSVTGVLKLSLSQEHPVKVMRGSRDGSILFCTHPCSQSITSWDVQTGGLIHTFTLKWIVKDIAVSLEGHYLACSLSNGNVIFWEVANRVEGPTLMGSSRVTHLCWLMPEAQLVVAGLTSVRIWDVIDATILHSFQTQDSIYGAAYSRKLDRLAIVTSLGVESTITIIDPRAGTSLASYSIRGWISCFAFSKTTEELVCGMKTHGLQLLNISTGAWEHFDHPATITSVSMLPNGTVVANVAGSGIQLLNLNEGSAISRQPITPALTMHAVDEDRILVIVPTSRDRVALLNLATMVQLLTIPARKTRTIPTDRIVVLCASFGNRIAVHCFEELGKENLELWRFGHEYPVWTTEIEGLPSIGRISPDGDRVVTFHDVLSRTCICIWSAENGRLLARQLRDYGSPARLLDVTFDSERKFYSHHDTCRVLYVIISSLDSNGLSHSISRRGLLPAGDPLPKRQFYVDDSHEWVVSGSQRICWIPPGYIGSVRSSYCWVGSSLFMAGQDGALRKLTFENCCHEGPDI